MNTEDALRELDKLREAVSTAHLFLSRRDEMNAAGHLSTVIRYSPLTNQLYHAEESILTLEQHFKDKK